MMSEIDSRDKKGTVAQLRPEVQLKYDPATGDNNLEEFSEELEYALKVYFGQYSRVVRKGKIDPAWIQNIPPLELEAEAGMPIAVRTARDEAKKLVQGWKEARARMVPHIRANITASSRQRINERHREEFTTACQDDDIEGLWRIITSTHLYRNVEATASEISEKQAQFLTFAWESGESIPNHLHRFMTLIRARERLQITCDTSFTVMHYCKSLNAHANEHVRKICTDTIVKINGLGADERNDPKWVVADVYREILGLMVASQTRPTESGKAPAPMALAAHSINKAVQKQGVNPANPRTEEYIAKKLAGDASLTRGQVLREIECHHCGKKGHIKADCRSESGPTTKGNGGKKRPPKKSNEALAAYAEGEDEDFSLDLDAAAFMVRVSLGAAFAATSGSDHNGDSMYWYDDSLANVPICKDVQLLNNVRKLKTPMSVDGIATAKVEYIGTHPFLGNVLVMPQLKFNIIPQQFWTKKLGYSLHLDTDGRWLQMRREGGIPITFHRTAANFLRVHNDLLRWSAEGPAVPPPKVVSGVRSSAEGISDAPVVMISDASKYYTAEQRQRASEAAQLHEQIGHPSDAVLQLYIKSPSLTNCNLSAQDVVNMRDIEGPCPVCMAGKPAMRRGLNSMHEQLGVTDPGQLLHCDLVYWSSRTYLLCVDEVTGYVFMPQLTSKRTNDVMTGFKIVIDALRASRRVLQYVHCDAESVFKGLTELLHAQGVMLKARIPGEHEVVAERAFRSIREKIRVYLAGIRSKGLPHPSYFEPYLMQHVVSMRNRLPNSRSGTAIPSELMHGERVNFLTDCRVGYYDLVLTARAMAKQVNPSDAKHEVCLCLGLVGRGTPGAVWALPIDSARPMQRRPMRVMPYSEDWRRALKEFAEKHKESAFDDLLLEFGANAKYIETVEDRENNLLDGIPDKDPVDIKRLLESGAMLKESTKIDEVTAHGKAVVHEKETTEQVSVEDSVARDTGIVPAAPATPRHTTASDNATTEVARPTNTERENTNTPLRAVAKREPEAAIPINTAPMELRRSTRERKQSKWLAGTTGENRTAFLTLGESLPEDDLLKGQPLAGPMSKYNTFARAGMDDHSDEFYNVRDDFQMVCMVSALEAALRTDHREEAIAATVKELRSLISHRTWRYLRKEGERQPSVHKGVEPSACILKDKKDANGKFLLFKSRFYNVGSRVDPNNYDPFDKTAPTASHDMLCLLIAYANYHKLLFETFDVPSAYVKSPLPDGKRHLMRINRTVARILVEVDPEARRYVNEDGTILVELLQALYGLPEAGQLWHKFLTNIFEKAGYEHMPNDTCVWKREHGTRDQKQISIVAIVVDDVLHVYNKLAAREHLYKVMRDERIPNVTVQPLSEDTPISFCGISLEYAHDKSVFMSQPGYLHTVVNEYAESDRTHPTPLPANFATRKLGAEQMEPLPGGTGKFLRVLNSIAWMERTRPDIAAAVSYLQTQQANPRMVDWQDVQHVLGYLRGTGNLGILFNVKQLKPQGYIDVGWAVHERDRKSHTGLLITMGQGGPPVEWGSTKQKSVASSSTEAELIGLSDKADSLLLLRSRMKFLGVHEMGPIEIFQDNTSTVTISYMGRPSAAARRRYIDIRYFWFKQYLDAKILSLVYCPSRVMYADALASIRAGQEFAEFVRRVMSRAPPVRKGPRTDQSL